MRKFLAALAALVFSSVVLAQTKTYATLYPPTAGPYATQIAIVGQSGNSYNPNLGPQPVYYNDIPALMQDGWTTINPSVVSAPSNAYLLSTNNVGTLQATIAGQGSLLCNGALSGSAAPAPCYTGDVYATAYGVTANAKLLLSNVTIAASSTALNVTSAAFTSSDVGKQIDIPGAGVSGAPLITTISAYTSATQVTLAAAASTALTAVSTWVTYGTDDSLALSNAAAACNGRMWVPSGAILLGGAATTTINHCVLEAPVVPGSDSSSGYSSTQGTTFLITSPTVKPFILEAAFAVKGAAFLWPNNIYAPSNVPIAYPALFSDGGASHGFNHGTLDSITILNAYDGMVVSAGGDTGDVKVVNSTMWSYRHLFALTNTGDSWAFSNNRFTPGPLLNLCNFITACENSINAGGAQNAVIYDFTGGTVSFTLVGGETFDWRYFIQIASGGLIGQSIVSGVSFDGLATIIDSSAAGGWASQNSIVGILGPACGQVTVYGGTNTGNYPCFNLGTADGLYLNGAVSISSSGSFIVAAGGNTISLNNVQLVNVGTANDGGDYYGINLLAATNNVIVSNSQFEGLASNAHVHAINIGTNTIGGPPGVSVTNTVFTYWNDIIEGSTANTVFLSGNSSSNTNTGGTSVSIIGGGQRFYTNNNWDVPPSGGNVQQNGDYILAQSALPMIVPSSGSMANNGVVTFTTALPTTYARAYVYMPSGAISSGSAAGWYYALCSSTTVCTLKNNLANTNGPIVAPSSPTAFVTTGPGAYTQSHTVDTAVTVNLPGGWLGLNGELVVDAYASIPNNSDTTQLNYNYYGVVNIGGCAMSNSTNVHCKTTLRQSNSASAGTSYTNMYLGASATLSAPVYNTVNTATTGPFYLQLYQATSVLDYIVLESYSIRTQPN